MPISLDQPGPVAAFPDLEPLIKGTELIGSQQARLYQSQQADADRNALWQQRLQAADMRQQERLDAQSQFIDQRFQNQQQLLGQQGQQQKDLWDYKYTTKQQRDIAQIENNENVMQQRADEALQNAQQAQSPQDAYMWNQRAQQYLQSKNSLTAKKMGIKPVPSPKPPPADLNMEAQNNLFWTAPHDMIAPTDVTLANGQVVPQGGPIPQGQIIKGVPPGIVAKRTKDGWTTEALPEPEYMAQQREAAMKERAAALDEKQQATQLEHTNITAWQQHNIGTEKDYRDEVKTAQQEYKAKMGEWQGYYKLEYDALVAKEKDKEPGDQKPPAVLQGMAEANVNKWHPKPELQMPDKPAKLSYPEWKQQFLPDQAQAGTVAQPPTPPQAGPAAAPQVAQPGAVAPNFGNFGGAPPLPPQSPPKTDPNSYASPLPSPKAKDEAHEGHWYLIQGKKYVWHSGKFISEDKWRADNP